jgi:hypothetical protein
MGLFAWEGSGVRILLTGYTVRQWLRDVNARERGREIQAEIDAADIAPEFTPEQLAEASSALQ